MRGKTIALDLGSVNTCIYQLGAGVVLSEPSAVAYTEGAKKKIKAVGAEAKKLVGEEDLDEILLGIPEKPENLGKRILAKAKYDVVKRN